MTSITIITTTATFGVDGDHWARDPDGDVYVYADDVNDPVAHVTADQFVAALRTADAVDNTDDLAGVGPGVTDTIEQAVRDALDAEPTPSSP